MRSIGFPLRVLISTTLLFVLATCEAPLDLSAPIKKSSNHRLTNTILNRCKMPADGDILVPIQTVSVIGTTDVRVTDPEHLTIEPWEVALLLIEGDKLIPGLSQARILRAWAGVRPLYQENFSGDSRDATRALALIDHQQRHDRPGLISIVGGKWTTFRLMAEKTMDRMRPLAIEAKFPPCSMLPLVLKLRTWQASPPASASDRLACRE